MNYSLILDHVMATRTGTWPERSSADEQFNRPQAYTLYQSDGQITLSEWSVDDNPPDIGAFTSDDDTAAQLAFEEHLQASKAEAWKRAENRFLTICDQLTGTASHQKLSFAELDAIISGMPAEQFAVQILTAVRLQALNSELARFDILWWDNCAWHAEVEP